MYTLFRVLISGVRNLGSKNYLVMDDILTTGMVNMFNDYHQRRKQLEKKHRQETNEQERQYWLDPAVAHNIPRPVYNITRERYFGGMKELHREELDRLDAEYIKGNPSTVAQDRLQANDNETGEPANIMNLAKVNVFNEAERRYADWLIAENAKNNRAGTDATHP